MRSFTHKISLLGVLFASVFTLLAQTTNPFTGQWELDASKSKFSPGPGLKSETVTVADGKTTVEGIDSTGKTFKWSYTPSPGTAVPIQGEENSNSTVLEKISGNTIDHTWTGGGGNTHGHGVVSKDGKTMKYVQNGKDDQGRPVHNVYIFERK